MRTTGAALWAAALLPGLAAAAVPGPAAGARPLREGLAPGHVRVGFFHGGRCHHLYRTFLYGHFEEEGVPAHLYTSFLDDQLRFEPIPRSFRRLRRRRKRDRMGRTTGTSIIKAIEDGALDAGCVGESSFIQAVHQGKPVVAVAQLGHEFRDKPGKVIATRKGLKLRSSAELKGKVLTTRRAGPGDAVFLKEYLRQEGLVPGKDVTVLEQVSDDDQHNWLKEGKVDGGLYHLFGVSKMIRRGEANLFRPMDWIDPEMSCAVLVFHKRFLKDRPEDARAVVRAYAGRVLYEDRLPMEEKLESAGLKFGRIMYYEYEGMRLPGASYPPLLKLELLHKMQDLLVLHGVLPKAVDLSAAVDQRYVEEFVREQGPD